MATFFLPLPAIVVAALVVSAALALATPKIGRAGTTAQVETLHLPAAMHSVAPEGKLTAVDKHFNENVTEDMRVRVSRQRNVPTNSQATFVSKGGTIPPGFPDESTTGVADGVALERYAGPMRITQDGTVIENKVIEGTLKVIARNVIVRNSRINYGGWWGVDADGAENITVEDCDIVGPGYNGDSNAAILGSGNFMRNNISRSENGIVLQNGASIVQGNFIHDLEDGSIDPHYDGISVQGGQNDVLIEGNTVVARDTSDIFIKNDFGPIANIKVNGNYLAGTPGINIYVDGRALGGPIVGVSITNNYLVKGHYGYYSIDNSSPTISGNIETLPEEASEDHTLLEIGHDEMLPATGRSGARDETKDGL